MRYMIKRLLTQTILKNQQTGFINLIYGPRRVGKTILLEQLTVNIPKGDMLWFNGDTQETRTTLSTTSEVALRNLVQKANIVVIDEAQRISNIGLVLKILIDAFPQKTFYVTGSSSLLLSRGTQEPLTGRNKTYRLYPLSTVEIANHLPDYQKPALLYEQLRFGGYPYLQQLTQETEKKSYLRSIVSDYLFKDLFLLKEIEQPDNLRKLATLLSFQVGSQVSYNELATNLLIDTKTVMRYITLLKESFILFEIGSFAKNLRSELTKAKKYYFWDLGIRNALIDQFLSLDIRPDRGQLWENFLAIERMKKHEYTNIHRSYYFWRTYEQTEIDWIETHEDNLEAYEFKWKEKAKTPKAFKDAYKISTGTISTNNYLEFIT